MSNKPKDALFIGATVVGAKDGEEFFAEAKVPGTMTKSATIASYLEKVASTRQLHQQMVPASFADSSVPNDQAYENHVHRPCVGVLHSVTVLDRDGQKMYHQVSPEAGEVGKVAVPFIGFLKEQLPSQFATNLRDSDAEPDVVLFGLDIKQVLRIAAFEVLRRNVAQSSLERLAVPVRLWHSPIAAYNPLDVAFSGSDRRDLDLYSLLRYLKIKHSVGEVTTDSYAQAKVVFELVKRMQLTASLL